MRASGQARGRSAAERRGRRAESLAALWLIIHGWRIVARRRRMPAIEVDIVARRGNVLAIVEVKRRSTLDAALMALTPQALGRLQVAAAQLAAESGAAGARPVSARVDLIALAPGRWPRHIPGVQ
ncbi:MAG: YraN family protein [Sandaracinobacteroides sp.]